MRVCIIIMTSDVGVGVDVGVGLNAGGYRCRGVFGCGHGFV